MRDRPVDPSALVDDETPDDFDPVAVIDRSKTVMPSPATRKLAMLIRLLETLCRDSIPESET